MNVTCVFYQLLSSSVFEDLNTDMGDFYEMYAVTALGGLVWDVTNRGGSRSRKVKAASLT